MNLFDNIIKSQFNQFTGQAQPQVHSFATPQAPRTMNYNQPSITNVRPSPYGDNPVDTSQNLFTRIMTPLETGIRTLSQNIQQGGKQISDIAMQHSQNVIDKGYNQGYINLGKKIKAKHPQYSDIPDEELGRKMLDKYPQYQDIVDEGNGITSNPISGSLASVESGLSKGLGTMFSGISALGSAPLQETGVAGVTRFAEGALETGLGSAQTASSIMPTTLGYKALVAPTVNTLFSTDTAGKVLQPITEGIGTGIGMGQEALGLNPNSSVSKDIQNIGSTVGTMGLLMGAHKGGAKLYEGAKNTGKIVLRGADAVAPRVVQGVKFGTDIVTSPVKSIINTAKRYTGTPEEISGIQSAIKPKQRVKNGVVQRSQDAINKEITLTNSLIRESGGKPTDLATYKTAIKGEMEKIGKEINRLTGQDMSIDITPSTAKLRQLANSDIVKTLDPADTNALIGLADRLDANGGRMSLSMAEEMNQWLNSVLKDTTVPKSEAYKRGLMTLVEDIRDGIDKSISEIPGQFKGIKKAYGALRNIYGDIVAREIVFNRQNMGGLVDSIGAIEGAGNIVSGGGKILMGDIRAGVADIGKGIASNAMGRFIKSKNDPNNIIRSIFEKGGNKSTLPNIPNKPTNGNIPRNITNTPTTSKTKSIKKQVVKPTTKPVIKPPTTPPKPTKTIVVPKNIQNNPIVKKEGIKPMKTEETKSKKKKPNKSLTPTTNAKQQVSNPGTSDTIPEGYFKNMFGEIVKEPNWKKGGFIRNPFAKPEPKRLFAGENSAQPPSKKTGWFKGADGKMRFEIDDSGAKVNTELHTEKGRKTYKLKDILQHNELYKQYPELENLDISIDVQDYYTKGGAYNGDKIKVNTSNIVNEGTISVILHEIQHAIQDVEGFAKGTDIIGRPERIKAEAEISLKGNPSFINKIYQKARISLTEKQWSKMTREQQGQSMEQDYLASAGEVEARNVQKRLGMSSKERALKSPESTEDVPRAKQIVRMEGGKAMSINKPEGIKNISKESGIDTKLIEEAIMSVSNNLIKKIDEIPEIWREKFKENPQEVISNALYNINKEAKKIRDKRTILKESMFDSDEGYQTTARHNKLKEMYDEMQGIYKYKDEYLHKIIEKYNLKPKGYHEFDNGDLMDYYEFGGQGFHLPENKSKINLGEISGEITSEKAGNNMSLNTAKNILGVLDDILDIKDINKLPLGFKKIAGNSTSVPKGLQFKDMGNDEIIIRNADEYKTKDSNEYKKYLEDLRNRKEIALQNKKNNIKIQDKQIENIEKTEIKRIYNENIIKLSKELNEQAKIADTLIKELTGRKYKYEVINEKALKDSDKTLKFENLEDAKKTSLNISGYKKTNEKMQYLKENKKSILDGESKQFKNDMINNSFSKITGYKTIDSIVRKRYGFNRGQGLLNEINESIGILENKINKANKIGGLILGDFELRVLNDELDYLKKIYEQAHK